MRKCDACDKNLEPLDEVRIIRSTRFYPEERVHADQVLCDLLRLDEKFPTGTYGPRIPKQR